MKYSLDKYRYYQHNNKVIAISTFAGKTVKGVAKCSPEDEFDFENGKKLAAMRCAQKVAMKRLKRANQKYLEALNAVNEAVDYFARMKEYYVDAIDALDETTAELAKISEQL